MCSAIQWWRLRLNAVQSVQFATRPRGAKYSTIPEITSTVAQSINSIEVKPRKLNGRVTSAGFLTRVTAFDDRLWLWAVFGFEMIVSAADISSIPMKGFGWGALARGHVLQRSLLGRAQVLQHARLDPLSHWRLAATYHLHHWLRRSPFPSRVPFQIPTHVPGRGRAVG